MDSPSIIATRDESDILELRRIWERHVNLGSQKPMSYLPMTTIRNLYRMGPSQYIQIIRHRGNHVLQFTGTKSFVFGGAVYAFHYRSLKRVLARHRRVLAKAHWPRSPKAFVARVAREWTVGPKPLLLVIGEAFGDRDELARCLASGTRHYL